MQIWSEQDQSLLCDMKGTAVERILPPQQGSVKLKKKTPLSFTATVHSPGLLQLQLLFSKTNIDVSSHTKKKKKADMIMRKKTN